MKTSFSVGLLEDLTEKEEKKNTFVHGKETASGSDLRLTSSSLYEQVKTGDSVMTGRIRIWKAKEVGNLMLRKQYNKLKKTSLMCRNTISLKGTGGKGDHMSKLKIYIKQICLHNPYKLINTKNI